MIVFLDLEGIGLRSGSGPGGVGGMTSVGLGVVDDAISSEGG